MIGRPPLPVEDGPPAEPLATLILTWADGRVTDEIMPASLAAYMVIWGGSNGDTIKSARVVYPAGAVDRFGGSA